MNATQQKLVEMKKNIPDCTSSRQRLRSILSDYFPTEKQLINSILNAYDEDIEIRLKSSSDPTLTALQMIKVLQNDYGLTIPSAFTAVEAWCYMIGYSEIAEALSNTNIAQQPSGQPMQPSLTSQPSVEVGLGILKAGIDIPSGELRLQLLKKTQLGINYGIGKSPNKINYDEEFRDTTYIRIKDGEYLKLYCFETESDYKIRITKVD